MNSLIISLIQKLKEHKLAVLVVGALVTVTLIWSFVIRLQESVLLDRARTRTELEEKIKFAKAAAANLGAYRVDLDETSKLLLGIQEPMAQGDLYRWIIKEMRDLQERYDVSISDFEPPQLLEAETALKVPYKAVHFTIVGTAHYHGVGSFLAVLENQFPFIRVRKLELDSVTGRHQETGEPERLTFKLEFSTLVKPSALLP